MKLDGLGRLLEDVFLQSRPLAQNLDPSRVGVGVLDSEIEQPTQLIAVAALAQHAGLEHIAIVGIELHAHSYDGSQGAEAGILWLGGNGDLLIEDCFIHGYKDNIVINGFGETATNLRIRGSVIADAYSTVGHAQGLYAEQAAGILIEGCAFDHNGWLDGVPGAEPTVFNHNVYIQSNCTDIDILDSLLIDASSHAVQLRCTGTVQRCLFLSNPIGLLVGNGGEAPPAETLIADNVFLFADDVSAEFPRGMGIDLQNITSGQIVGNLLAQSDSIHENGHALKMQGSAASPVNGVSFTANIVHDWPGGIRFNKTDINGAVIAANIIDISDTDVPLVKHAGDLTQIDIDYTENRYHSEAPEHIWFQIAFDAYGFEEWKSIADEYDALATPTNFSDPYRTPESYQSHIGEEPTYKAFIDAIRAQSRHDWDKRYTSKAIIAYFQSGYAPSP